MLTGTYKFLNIVEVFILVMESADTSVVMPIQTEGIIALAKKLFLSATSVTSN